MQRPSILAVWYANLDARTDQHQAVVLPSRKGDKNGGFNALFTIFLVKATGRAQRDNKNGGANEVKKQKKRGVESIFLFFQGLIHVSLRAYMRAWSSNFVFGKAHLVEQNKVHPHLLLCRLRMHEKVPVFISVAASVLE